MTGQCRLCGAPLGSGAADDGGFCCAGCARVYEVLQSIDGNAGEAYLRAARRFGIIPDRDFPPAETSGPEEMVDESAVKRDRFDLDGLVCPSCSWVVEQVARCSEGVLEADADFFSSTLSVRYDMRRTSPDRLLSSLRPFGYRLTRIDDPSTSAVNRRATFAFAASAVLSVNIMSLSALRYFERAGAIDEVPDYLVVVELLLSALVLLVGLGPVLRRAWAGIARAAVTMDLFIAFAATAAFGLSLAALLTGRDQIYFETAAGLVTISLLSRLIEARLRMRAFADLTGLMRMPVRRVRLLGDGDREEYAAVDQAEPGRTALFRGSEMVPFDGTLLSADALVDEAVLTGEPRPVTKVRGDRVMAGSSVVSDELRLRIDVPFSATRLHRIAESVRHSLRTAEARLRSSDRISAAFAPIVLLIAFGAWVVRFALHGVDYALSAEGWFPSVAVLAVACPCAFSLAGVLAITAACGSLIRKGILVKEMEQLETLHQIDHVIFDKTGTLTLGEMSVDGLCWRDAPVPDELALVLAAEQGSSHPVANAIRFYLQQQSLEAPANPPREVIDAEGSGRLAKQGSREFRVGSARLFDDPFEPAGITPRHSAVWFGFDGRADGCFLFTDRIREDAAAAIEELQAAGIGVEILSGDRDDVTRWVAGNLGITSARGNLSMEQKVQIVQQRLDQKRRVAFIGDGTNDALAMSQATVSVALRRATDEALAASGFVLHKPSIKGVVELLRSGKKLHRVITGNYLWAFAFNILFIPIAAMGLLLPLFAVTLMLLSSLAVLLHSLRMR